MFARLLVLASLVLVTLCAGCTEPEPEYEASIVKFDERLLGTWMFHESDDVVKITVTGRGRSVLEGRVKAEALGDKDGGGQPLDHNAYVIVIEADVDTKEEGADGKPVVEHVRIELKGVAISIDGVTMLAAQASTQQLGIAHLGGLILPVHQLIRYDLAGDTLTVQQTEDGLAWLPGVEWLDAPQELADLPTLRRGGNKLIVTNDIDRLVQVLRANMNQEGFWQEESLVLTRAR